MSRTTHQAGPPRPYAAVDHEPPEEHPVDRAIDSRLPLRKLRRRIRNATDRLMAGLGEQHHLWLRLEELLGEYRARREEAYFDLGYEHGVAAGRAEALRALACPSETGPAPDEARGPWPTRFAI